MIRMFQSRNRDTSDFKIGNAVVPAANASFQSRNRDTSDFKY